jgi:hypothetical protein
MPTKSAPRLQGRRTGEVSDQHLPDQLAPYGEGAKRRVLNRSGLIGGSNS